MSTADDKKIDALDAAISRGIEAYAALCEDKRNSIYDCRKAQAEAFEATLAEHGFRVEAA